MFSRFSQRAPQAEAVSLEHYAERAGAAWACTFSTSAEYDAALIAERRAAGVYGPRRLRRQLFLTVAGIGSALGIIALLIGAFS
ncbi:MAG: hypothetical protein Q8M24_12880 [Pseudolabrys sp.]|nr:hypothetical protein [Pseudolabrys sp.]MDP2296343.1 hypothetical protein [Pseudolabrys sp.]